MSKDLKHLIPGNGVPKLQGKHKLDVFFLYRKDNKNDYKIKIFDEKVRQGNEDYAESEGYKLVKVNFYCLFLKSFINMTQGTDKK